MQSKLDHALGLAAKGFWIFPVRPWPEGDPGREGKQPAIKSWQALATRDAGKITDWWQRRPDYNIGIFTGRFGDARSDGAVTRYGGLLAVDVDVKPGKGGEGSLTALEMENGDLPDTLENATPSGGRHIIFTLAAPISNSVGTRLGQGLDTRSAGGYILGPGSTIAGVPYSTAIDAPIATAPQWLVDRCTAAVTGSARRGAAPEFQAERATALARGREYLAHAPLAIEGQGGDHQTFIVACWLRDMGAAEEHALEMMLDHWNDRCVPPWDPEELALKVRNAFEYGQNAAGTKAVETILKPLPPAELVAGEAAAPFPLERYNANHAHVVAGGGVQIIWETTDAKGRQTLEHLSIGAFHSIYAAEKIRYDGGREIQQTQAWIEWKERRSYDGFVFDPSSRAPERFYNLWRGFAAEPLPEGEAPAPDHQRAVDMFKEHLLQNVCAGEVDLCQWLWGYFAHLMQRPAEKPLVALVLKGAKGVGKNAVFDVIGGLLGASYKLTSNRRYLVSNFNGHMENLLLFVLDEAFWSGDKQAEGILKDLITGKSHQIEHKGKEQFEVDNLTRVAIIGNEDWLVPATADERRFAVFNVGAARQKQGAWFSFIKAQMAAGANRLLLRELLAFDLASVNVNVAPLTAGLLEQKHATLEPLPQFWLECLSDGYLIAGDVGQDWPKEIEVERVRHAFRRWARERNVRTRLPGDIDIGKMLKQIMPDLQKAKKTLHGARTSVYLMPTLDEARAQWSTFIGHGVTW